MYRHNTNITNVIKPGGTYNKWVLSKQDQNYLPFWMSAAGYRTEYIGTLYDELKGCWTASRLTQNLKAKL